MSAPPSEPSKHRVMWWARTYSRPLQAEFAADDQATPDDFNVLLEQADDRLSRPAKSQRDE